MKFLKNLVKAKEKPPLVENNVPVHPNSPEERAVACRALCLQAFVSRGTVEQMIQGTSECNEIQQHANMTQAINTWLDQENLRTHLSNLERALLSKPAGSWDEQGIITASWRQESLGCILWALQFLDLLPPYDTAFTQEDVSRHLPLLLPTVLFFQSAHLRPPDVIARARDVAEAWLWRARTTDVQEAGHKPPDGYTFQEIIAQSARNHHQMGHIPEPIQGDYPLFGGPYSELAEEEHSLARSIAVERLWALNWLCGYSQDWDETPIDT